MNNPTITARLAEPFAADQLDWKPQAVKGNRALAVPYIDARCVMDRLDQVLGVDGWQDDYTPLPDGSVVCRLSVRLNDQWVVKVDVGGQSDQDDKGDRMKAAFSDALKRAAVKLGIGRYLYSLPKQWADYDTQKRSFVKPPTLPPAALPKPTAPQGTVETRPAPSCNGLGSAGWRDKLVTTFTMATTWAAAKSAHAAIPAEVKAGLEPGDAEAVRKAWEQCQARLKPKANA